MSEMKRCSVWHLAEVEKPEDGRHATPPAPKKLDTPFDAPIVPPSGKHETPWDEETLRQIANASQRKDGYPVMLDGEQIGRATHVRFEEGNGLMASLALEGYSPSQIRPAGLEVWINATVYYDRNEIRMVKFRWPYLWERTEGQPMTNADKLKGIINDLIKREGADRDKLLKRAQDCFDQRMLDAAGGLLEHADAHSAQIGILNEVLARFEEDEPAEPPDTVERARALTDVWVRRFHDDYNEDDSVFHVTRKALDVVAVCLDMRKISGNKCWPAMLEKLDAFDAAVEELDA